MKKYKQKDLGYSRTPSTAKVHLKFSTGETWEIPAQVVIDDRDDNYKDDQEDTALFIADGSLSDYDVMDWLANNMNFSDVKPYARKIKDAKAIDFDEEFCNCEKEYVP